ncbi:MAG: hypothetical protein K2X93_28170, partial [Candidatus Obscuribacterales bacterium]|nr:hypothetical protein [Candidatus Obscuribacterales bacterium]
MAFSLQPFPQKEKEGKTGSSTGIRRNAYANLVKNSIESTRNKRLASLNEKANWQDILFIQSILEDARGEGVVVLADGSLRKYINVTGINLLLSDEYDRELLARQFGNLFDCAECDMQVLVKSRNLPVEEYLEQYQVHVKTDDEYLRRYAEYTDNWFREEQSLRFIPQREFYLLLSFQPPDTNAGRSWSGSRSPSAHDEYVYELNRFVQVAYDQLNQSYMKPKVLNQQEIRNLLFSTLNPGLTERERALPEPHPEYSECSALARSVLEVSDKNLWLDGKHVATHYLKEMPHNVWIGWFIELMSMPFEYTLSIFIHQCNQEQVRTALRYKYHFGKLTSRQLPTPDLELSEVTNQTEAAIQTFLRSSAKAFDVSMYVTCTADSQDRLNRSCDQINRVIQNRGAKMDRGKYLQLDAWQSTLPIGVDKLAIVHRVMSPVVGTLWPFFSAKCGTPTGVPFGFSLASGEPVLLDPFFLGAGKEAYNMFVVGMTGAGKSFAVSMLILRLLPTGMRFILLDKTVDRLGSYRFITELLGPKHCAYIDLGPNSGFVLNPFDLGDDDTDPDGRPTGDKVARLLSLLDLMLAEEGHDELDLQDKSILDKLIRQTYANTRLSSNRVPTMSDLAHFVNSAADIEIDNDRRKRMQNLGRGLSLFTADGAFGGLVDGHTNFDTGKLFIVFDTRDVNEPRLEKIAVYTLADFVRRTAAASKEEGVRLAAIIDEASTLMRFKAGARLLDDLSRRSRHYGMMLVSITQQLKDFFRQSDQADSVVKNAHMKILLRQDPSDLRLLRETLRLNEPEVDALSRFARDDLRRKESHALLIVGAIKGTVRFVPSPQDYWICTSEPIKDIPERRRMIEELQKKDPALNSTDACRQAVYLLGLRRG